MQNSLTRDLFAQLGERVEAARRECGSTQSATTLLQTMLLNGTAFGDRADRAEIDLHLSHGDRIYSNH